MARTAEFASKIFIPQKKSTEVFVGNDEKKLVVSEVTPASLVTMSNREISAGSSGVQGCNCSKKNCGTGGSNSICC